MEIHTTDAKENNWAIWVLVRVKQSLEVLPNMFKIRCVCFHIFPQLHRIKTRIQRVCRIGWPFPIPGCWGGRRQVASPLVSPLIPETGKRNGKLGNNEHTHFPLTLHPSHPDQLHEHCLKAKREFRQFY